MRRFGPIARFADLVILGRALWRLAQRKEFIGDVRSPSNHVSARETTQIGELALTAAAALRLVRQLWRRRRANRTT